MTDILQRLGRDAEARIVIERLRAALKAARVYVQDCIENGHDRTMLANMFGARDEIDAALAGKDASSPTSGVTSGPGDDK